MEQLNQVRSALIQGYDSLSAGDKIAAGIITVALIALAVGVTMAAGGSGAKALSSLAASPLLYLGVTTTYSKLINSSEAEAVEEEEAVEETQEERLVLAKTTAIDKALESKKSALSDEMINLIRERNEALEALPGTHSLHTEVKGQPVHGFWRGGQDEEIIDAALQEVKKISSEEKEALKGQVKALFEAIGRLVDPRFTFHLGYIS